MLAADATGAHARIAPASTAAVRWRQNSSILKILTAARQPAKLMDIKLILRRGG
jgi:hypothetical protein